VKALNRSMVVGGAARASVGFGSQANLNLENLMSALSSKAEICLVANSLLDAAVSRCGS
jgi:hypothetical protein